MNVLTVSASAMMVKCAAFGLLVGMLLGCMIGAALLQEVYDRRRRAEKEKAERIAKHQPPHGFYKGSLYLHNDHLKDEF